MRISKSITIGILATSTLFTMNSCSVATENIEVEQIKQNFVFEDIDEGSNAAQLDINSSTVFYANEEITAENIHKATISSIEISKNDSLSFSEIESVTFSVLGDENSMVSIALLNPIPEDSKTIKLEFSEEADIMPYIKEGDFYLILDATFKTEDYENKKTLSATIKYNVEVTK